MKISKLEKVLFSAALCLVIAFILKGGVEELNQKIKELIEKNEITQAKLADIAGVSPAFISGVIKGYKIPSVAVLKRIADYFNLTVDDLID